MASIDDYPVSRVPDSARLPFFNVALVHIGMLTALDQFMLGAVLGHGMSSGDAFLAIAIGSAIFGVATLGLGYAGMKEGLSGSLLARWCGFGRLGAVLIGAIIAISLLGWFGVQNAVFARSLNYALGDRLGFGVAATLSGCALTLLVTFGFRALRYTARIAVPLFIMVVGYISVMTLSGHSLAALWQTAASGEAITVSAGATMVVRLYCRKPHHTGYDALFPAGQACDVDNFAVYHHRRVLRQRAGNVDCPGTEYGGYRDHHVTDRRGYRVDNRDFLHAAN